MIVLGIESSCDETAVAAVRDGRCVLSSRVASQIDRHAVFGGVVPELASRLHMESLVPLTEQALAQAGLTLQDIDAVAVTAMPGLIGALLTGVNYAKGLALGLGVPLVPVHHLRGHAAALYLTETPLAPPFTALIVSGGHSLLCHAEDYVNYRFLGGTRDDAAGEALDKVARTLGLPYPGGAALSKLAQTGDPAAYRFPRAAVEGFPLDMSFSGLKTFAVNLLHNARQKGEDVPLADFCASFEQAVTDALAPRLLLAARETGCTTVACAGGVAANRRLRETLSALCGREGLELFLPPPELCGDNAAMIAAQGFHELRAGRAAGMDLNAFATRDI